MWGSTIPAALDALVDAFKVATDAQVVKGPNVSGTARKEVVLVGWDGLNENLSVQLDLAEFDRARSRQTERYTIVGAVLVTSGSTNLDPFIARAFEIFGQLGEALISDKTLAGAVTDAKLSNAGLDLSQIASGALVRIPYTVSVLALTSR